MILFIDTTDFKSANFALIGPKIKAKKYALPKGSEKTLAALASFLGKNKLVEVEKIILVSGPGSFSGIRTGAAIALAFGFAAGVPVFSIKKQQLPADLADLNNSKKVRLQKFKTADYGIAPNISPEKKKILRNT